MAIKIAIADDHPMIIDGVQNMLHRYPHITLTHTYSNGTQLLQGLQSDMPDILILDIQMPDKTGDELVPIILKKYPDLRILILTNFDSVLYAYNMFKRGAHGYLLKTAEKELIINAIEAIYNGDEYIETSMKEKLHQLKARIKQTVFSKSSLTPREKEILQLIIDGDTCPEISQKLFLSLSTVINYRTSIMLKLDVKNTATLVKKAFKLGLAEWN